MPSPFHVLVRNHLARLGWSQADLALKLDLQPVRLSRILTGATRVDAQHAPRWADAMGLHGADRDELIMEMALASLPPLAQQAVRNLQDELARLRAQLAERDARLRQISEAIRDLPPPR